MSQVGIINPITVRPNKHGTYDLIAGRHRIAAAIELAWTHIPAIVRHDDDHAAKRVRLAENVARSQLSAVEEARQLAELLADEPQGVDAIAAATGRSVNWILDRLELLEWPDSLQHAVHKKRIPVSAAKLLSRIQPPELREQRIHDAATHGINARTARLWLNASLPLETPQTELPQNYGEPRENPQIQKIFLECFSCRTPVEPKDTIPARICNECLQQMQAAQRQHEQTDRPMAQTRTTPQPPHHDDTHAGPNKPTLPNDYPDYVGKW